MYWQQQLLLLLVVVLLLLAGCVLAHTRVAARWREVCVSACVCVRACAVVVVCVVGGGQLEDSWQHQECSLAQRDE
jgi:hypothetical protein